MNIACELYFEIEKLFETKGKENYFGEEVSQYEHACQTAMLAKNAGATIELQRAAFLHDIGHILPSESVNFIFDKYGNLNHEKSGASWLASRGFSEMMIQVVKNHVDAKRYLCYKKPNYFHHLSDSSRVTLLLQGGAMLEAEALLFEQNMYFDEIIQVRQWDDLAKDTEIIVPKLEIFLKELFALNIHEEQFQFETNIFLE
jgi:2-amino-1-hydroxyethylphosphonate dioxygenase (glycine-forming)